jgi:hypothetical protein
MTSHVLRQQKKALNHKTNLFSLCFGRSRNYSKFKKQQITTLIIRIQSNELFVKNQWSISSTFSPGTFAHKNLTFDEIDLKR